MSKENIREELKNDIDSDLFNDEIIKWFKFSKISLIIGFVWLLILILLAAIFPIVFEFELNIASELSLYISLVIIAILSQFIFMVWFQDIILKVNIRKIYLQFNQTFIIKILEIILKDFKKFQILKTTSDWENGLIYLTDGDLVIQNKLNTSELLKINIFKAKKINNQKTTQIAFLKETILNVFMKDFYENIETSISERK